MKTLRSFMDDLREYGELKTLEEEVHWDLQASAICAMSQRVGGPAVHFTKISGYPHSSLVGSLFSGPGYAYPKERKMQGRIAVGLGLEPSSHYDELMEVLSERKQAPIRAIEVTSGPIQDCIIPGEEVDIYRFPIPRLHEGDGGRYLTSHIVLTKDPETGWTNWAVYRCMVLGKNKLVTSSPIKGPALMGKRHIEAIFNKYASRKEPMPFAIVIGVSPAQLMTAAMNLGEGMDEASIAGGLMLEPIPMIKAQLSDILIPADAEIVFEGHVYPGEIALEGPFAGISRYTERGTGLVYTVELINHRKDPILPFVTPSVKTGDALALFSVLHSHELFELLRKQAFPVRWVTLPVEAKLCLCFVSTDTYLHAGLPKRIASIIFARSPLVEHLVILDSDVDSEDLATAFNDSHQKAHPGRNYHISKIDRILSPTANHDLDTGKSSTLYADATWRVDRPAINIPKRVGFETSYPLEMQERVIKRWEELGLFPKPIWRKPLAQN